METIKLLDTTLRDGTQAAGVSLSVDDKLKITKALDELGVHYIEGGWPGSNPKDEEFFKKARRLSLKNSRLVAFGSTRRKGIAASKDANLAKILRVGVKTACIFGKTWDFHVLHALRTTLDENLKMIHDSVKYLKSKKIEVIYDAEHFFDGFVAHHEYAMKTVHAAVAAGADNISLCDTNGGMPPHRVQEIVRFVRKNIHVPLGMHMHNDGDCAVANTLIGVQEGAVLVQGTINGLGERTGNANLTSVIPGIMLKLNKPCISKKQLRMVTEVSRYTAELCNMVLRDNQPYTGHAAFAHKGGVHASAMARHEKTYEHIDPALVGNKRRILVSELSGRSNVLLKTKELKIDFDDRSDVIKRIIDSVKKMEKNGFQYEGAEGSFALIVHKSAGTYQPFFELKGFRVLVEKDWRTRQMVSEATIKVKVGDTVEHTVAEGDGPVNALDSALRKALEKFYPKLSEVSLTDFRVRVINASGGTAAKVRVIIESRDGKDIWGTIGVSENIIEASWQALADSVEYKLLKDQTESKKK
ncbi:MAG: citramalate synthase [Elusimicrobia bacterium]|nr:citramalate synthase [Elusimicrobiota bacterium]MBD3412486.1 citramalate synthase [Elusimicrobiota bacterium]